MRLFVDENISLMTVEALRAMGTMSATSAARQVKGCETTCCGRWRSGKSAS